MNTLQKKIVIGGLVIVGLMALFPPWTKRLYGYRGMIDTPLGYSFIMTPPRWVPLSKRLPPAPTVGRPAPTGGTFLSAYEIQFDQDDDQLKPSAAIQTAGPPVYPHLPPRRPDPYAASVGSGVVEIPSSRGVKIDLERLFLQAGAAISLAGAAYFFARD